MQHLILLEGLLLSASNMAVGFFFERNTPVTIASDTLSGSNLTSDFGKADNLNTQNLNVSIGDSISGSASAIKGSNLSSNADLGNHSAQSIGANDLSFSHSASGSNIQLSQGSATGLNTSGGSVDQVSLRDLSAEGNISSQTGSASVGQLNVQGANHELGSAQDLQIDGISTVADKDNYSAKINNIQGNQFDVMGNSFQEGNIQNIEGNISRDFLSGSGTVGLVSASEFAGNVQTTDKNINYTTATPTCKT